MKLPFTHPMHTAIGFIIWSLWFVFIYAFLSIGCKTSPAPENLTSISWINVGLILFSCAIFLLLLFLGVFSWREIKNHTSKTTTFFIVVISTAAYIAAAISILFIGIPIFVLPPCL